MLLPRCGMPNVFRTRPGLRLPAVGSSFYRSCLTIRACPSYDAFIAQAWTTGKAGVLVARRARGSSAAARRRASRHSRLVWGGFGSVDVDLGWTWSTPLELLPQRG